jgi:WD40 repeat protein
MRRFLFLVALFVPPTQPPDTEVFLATLSIQAGKLTVGTPENISNSPGYDNQPAFSRDGASLYFTSARGGPAPETNEPQMDIYRYDIASKKTAQLTRTPESEYSATVTPDGRHLSVIRVEADKTQRLWKFTTAGSEPSVVLTDIKPVGYHAWLDEHTLALFVLGPPATLQVADTRTGKAVVAASDIGRSLQRIPGGGVSFVQRTGQGTRGLTIMELTLRDGKPVTSAVIGAAPGATEEYVAWTPDGTLLMPAGGALYGWRRGDKEWKAVANISLRNVSRLAVSPRGDSIAFVATAGGSGG